MGLRDRIAGEAAVDRSNDDDGDGVTYYRRRLLEEVDLSEIAELSAPQRRARLERVVGRMVTREGPVLSTAERTRLIRRVIDEAIGLGVLEPLLADPSVTEIMVNGPDEVYVERDGRLERAEITFTDEGSSTRRSTASSRRSTAASTSRARWSTPACPPASAST